MIKSTTFDESIWLKIPGERGAKDCFLGNIYMLSESKSTVKYIQMEFGKVAEDVQKVCKQGEVELIGDFNSGIGKANNPNGSIGQYGEETKNNIGEEMFKFLEHNEMKTLKRQIKKEEPEWTRQCMPKGETLSLTLS